MPASRSFQRWNKNYRVCVCACTWACVVSENQALAKQGQTQAQTQTKGMDLVKTKFDANKHKQNHASLLSILENCLPSIHCFQWPDTIKCGKYLCACVLSKRDFVFTCSSVIASIRGKKWSLYLCLRLYVYLRHCRFYCKTRTIVFALVLASLMKIRL